MTITVGGTSITFNDATTQSTAYVAPTTTQVLNATAGAAAGAVGTYMEATNGGNTTFGTTVAGSTLSPTGGFYQVSYAACAYTAATGATQAGTWRCMGRQSVIGAVFVTATLWLRIS